MSTSILLQHSWESITAAAQHRKQRSWVAVAFFGKSGPDLLPLTAGSHLVVNASESAVSQGLTHPGALMEMINNGVFVYSVDNLHAKVFVFGKTAFVGSANATENSAEVLMEAVVRTTDPGAVGDARDFIASLCQVELGPAELDRLQKLYRPPKFPGGKRSRSHSRDRRQHPELRRLRIAHLEWGDAPEGSEQTEQEGLDESKGKMVHPRRHELTDFHWHGRCPFQERDQVIQLTTESSGEILVSPPATVLGTRKWSNGRASCTFVYLESPKLRRKNLRAVCRKLGRGAKKTLLQSGTVIDRVFANQLREIWKR